MTTRVLFFLSDFPVSSETFVLNQINFLANQKDIFLDIYSIYGSELNAELKNNPRVNHYISQARQGALNKALFKFKSILMGLKNKKFSLSFCLDNLFYKKALLLPLLNSFPHNQYDVILTHFGDMGVLMHKMIQSQSLGSPKHLCVFHGYEMSNLGIWNQNKKFYKEMQSTTTLLPISEFWSRKLQDQLQIDSYQIKVHHMGVNVESFNFREPIKTSEPLEILSVARLTQKKGLVYSLIAVAQLIKQGYKIKYNIIGEGPLKNSFSKLIKELNVEDHIVLLGKQDHSIVNEYLQKSHLFVLTSVIGDDGDMEGIPVSLMEAMSVGTLVLTSRHSGISELVDPQCGFIVDEKNIEQIKTSIIQFTNLSQDQKNELAQQARKKIENEFNNKTLNEELLQLIIQKD